jgi:pimeloyl-ACP methyl ester carboxylesterase
MQIESRNMQCGCKLSVRSIRDNDSGIPIYMWGGVFGTYLIWSRLAAALRSNHPLYMIEYPGFNETSTLFSRRELDVALLAGFQQELMATAGHSKAILIGWSFGAQVVAECLQSPSSIEAVIAISGVPGKPFSHLSDPLFETIGIRPNLTQTVEWLAQKEEAVSRLRKMIRRNEHPSRWARRLGLMSPSADELIMDAIIRDFVNIPTRHYNYYQQMASRHNAGSAVKDAQIPILAVSGSLDKLITPRRSREFTRGDKSLREFLLVKGGTHFVPLEYPDLISLKIEEFLKRNRL